MRTRREDIKALRRDPVTGGDRTRRIRAERRLIASAASTGRVPARMRFRLLASGQVVTVGGGVRVPRVERMLESRDISRWDSEIVPMTIDVLSEADLAALRLEDDVRKLYARVADLPPVTAAISASAGPGRLSALDTDWPGLRTAKRGASASKRKAKHGRRSVTASARSDTGEEVSMLASVRRRAAEIRSQQRALALEQARLEDAQR